MAMNFFDAACTLVSIGFKVIPLHPGQKLPIIKAWQKVASDDADVLSDWSHRWPNANIGIVCGEPSGVCVIDVDVKGDRNGMSTLDALAKRGKKLPPCPIAVTPTGGRHLFFAMKPGLKNCAGLTRAGRGIGHGVDFRATGGFVVGAPSEIGDKRYRWLVPPVTPEFPRLPQWAVDALTTRKPKPTQFRERHTTDEDGQCLERIASWVSKAPEGQRNNSLYWAVRECVKHGISPGLVRQRLTEAALASKLDAHEIGATLDSGFKSEGVR